MEEEVCRLNSEIGTVQTKRHEILKNLDLFILDNSILYGYLFFWPSFIHADAIKFSHESKMLLANYHVAS